jgi:PPOX class probable F420-dependent enzyme
VTSFSSLAGERFISLTTFRRSGEAVSTPVWVASDGDALLVTTPAASGKVKRLRHTPRVEMRPCTRSGRVPEGAEPVSATAEILPEDRPDVFRAKYGLEYRIFMTVERLASRGNKARVLLRITPAG